MERMGAIDVFLRHVERFNDGVQTGDFSAMLGQFAADAEMVFEGVPAGPFRWRADVAGAYRSSPPDDQVVVLAEPVVDGDTAVAPYAWRAQPGTRAGEMRMTVAGGQIQRLVVTFDQAAR